MWRRVDSSALFALGSPCPCLRLNRGRQAELPYEEAARNYWKVMGMTDAFLILTPFLLLVVVALLGFVGCASFSATDSSAATALNLSASPSNVGAGGDSILTWNASGAQTAAIDQSVGTVYTYDATKPSAPTTGTTTVNPVATTTYTLSGKDTAGGPINVTVTPGTPPPHEIGRAHV